MLYGDNMNNELMKSESTLQFHLDGESQIDAKLLSKIINDFVELTQFAAKDIDSEAYLKMNITAFQNGSFNISFSAVCEFVKNLFSSENIAIASNILDTVVSYFNIKKFLKGKRPKPENVKQQSQNKVEIINADGSRIVVPKEAANIIYNTHIDNLTVNIANSVSEHNPNGGFSIKTKNHSTAFGKDDISNIEKTVAIDESNCKRYLIETALIIKKPDFISTSSAWDFIFNGKTIHAKIADEGFTKKVHNGEITLKSADYINARLEMIIDLDENNQPIDSTAKYTVLEVNGDVQHNDSNFSQTKIEI